MTLSANSRFRRCVGRPCRWAAHRVSRWSGRVIRCRRGSRRWRRMSLYTTERSGTVRFRACRVAGSEVDVRGARHRGRRDVFEFSGHGIEWNSDAVVGPDGAKCRLVAGLAVAGALELEGECHADRVGGTQRKRGRQVREHQVVVRGRVKFAGRAGGHLFDVAGEGDNRAWHQELGDRRLLERTSVGTPNGLGR